MHAIISEFTVYIHTYIVYFVKWILFQEIYINTEKMRSTSCCLIERPFNFVFLENISASFDP